MRLRQIAIAGLAVCFASLLGLLPSAAPQEKYDRDTYAREYI